MEVFIEEILEDLEWRISELATIKTIPVQYSFNESHRSLHYRNSIPIIYSMWEGFIKNTFAIYSRAINSLNLQREEISLNLLTHHIDSVCQFGNARTGFVTKRKIVSELDALFSEQIVLSTIVPTSSNVNYKVLSSILERFCVAPVNTSYKSSLDKLLLFRNKISHGENAISVNLSEVTEFILLVEDLMLDLIINIDEAYKTASFKRETRL